MSATETPLSRMVRPRAAIGDRANREAEGRVIVSVKVRECAPSG